MPSMAGTRELDDRHIHEFKLTPREVTQLEAALDGSADYGHREDSDD